MNKHRAAAPWTVGKVLGWTAHRFKKTGFRTPRLDAEVLLAAVLGCDRVTIYTDYHKPLTEQERSAYRELVRRRLAGEPAAYLVGQKEFWSLPFRVDREVLIPRPESELLVELALELTKDRTAPLILDVGTGSGCLAVAIAHERRDATVVASDISLHALDVARENATRNEVAVELRQGADLEPVTETESGTFDLIITNPPYIATTDLNRVDAHVLDHEPHGALLAGEDGLDVIRRLIAGAPDVLRPGGWFVTELDPVQVPAVDALLSAHGGYDQIAFRQDLAHRERAAVARRKPID